MIELSHFCCCPQSENSCFIFPSSVLTVYGRVIILDPVTFSWTEIGVPCVGERLLFMNSVNSTQLKKLAFTSILFIFIVCFFVTCTLSLMSLYLRGSQQRVLPDYFLSIISHIVPLTIWQPFPTKHHLSPVPATLKVSLGLQCCFNDTKAPRA